jgi:hypothetical protein
LERKVGWKMVRNDGNKGGGHCKKYSNDEKDEMYKGMGGENVLAFCLNCPFEERVLV